MLEISNSGRECEEAIFSQHEANRLRTLYHGALQKLHNLRQELARRETHNVVELRKSKKLPIMLLQKQIERALDDVASAKRAYAPFNPADYEYTRSSSRQPKSFDEDEEFKSGVNYLDKFLDITDAKYADCNDWIAWPEESKHVDFISVMKGIGDGEQRLAYLFGGSIMGGSKSYDLVIRGSGRWEVKDLTAGNSIRPCTQGTRMYLNVYNRLANAVKEMRDFLNEVFKPDCLTQVSERDLKMLMYVGDYLTANYTNLVESGEISKTRFVELKKVVTFVSTFKEKRESDVVHDLLTNDYFVEGIDHKTYISIAKQLAKTDEFVASRFDKVDFALDNLRDPMFDDPDELVKLVNSIKATSIFGVHADGLILVHKEKGFFVISHDRMDNLVIFDQVTQGKPKFKLVNRKTNNNEDNQSELQDRTVPAVPCCSEPCGVCSENVLQV